MEAEMTPTAPPSRRSKRNVSSTYATAQLVPCEVAKPRRTTPRRGSGAVVFDVEKVEDTDYSTHATRPTPTPTLVTVAAAATDSPPRATCAQERSVVSPASSAISPLTGAKTGNAPAGTRSRRASRRLMSQLTDAQLVGTNSPRGQGLVTINSVGDHDIGREAADTNANGRGGRWLLDKYSGDTAAALCDVIWLHVKENSLTPTVLQDDRSPAVIDWQRVAEQLERDHETAVPPRDCQLLWKFLTYGENHTSETLDDDAMQPDSDVDEYDVTATQFNHKCEEAIAFKQKQQQQQQKEVQQEQEGTAHVVSPRIENESEPVEPSEKPLSQETTSRSSSREPSSIQLYPVYHQPHGVPSSWCNSSAPAAIQATMPLVFVAEKFLKRKLQPSSVDPALMNGTTIATTTGNTSPSAASHPLGLDPRQLAAAANLTLSGETPKKSKGKSKSTVNRKRVIKTEGAPPLSTSNKEGDAIVAVDAAPKPKRSRKKKDASITAAKGQRMNKPAATDVTTVSTAAMRFMAPPPIPRPARGAFDFFVDISRQEMESTQSVAVINGDPATPTPTLPPTPTRPEVVHSEISSDALTQLQQRFHTAAPHIRELCRQMATDDMDRFRHESVRRRVWEKASAAVTASDAATVPVMRSEDAVTTEMSTNERATTTTGPVAPLTSRTASTSTTTTTTASATRTSSAIGVEPAGMAEPARVVADSSETTPSDMASRAEQQTA